MTNKQKLMFGSLVGIVALLGIILLLFIRQSQGQPHTSPAPQIDTNKVVKRINGELFTDAGFGTYLADPENYADSTYVDGQDLGSRNINDALVENGFEFFVANDAIGAPGQAAYDAATTNLGYVTSGVKPTADFISEL